MPLDEFKFKSASALLTLTAPYDHHWSAWVAFISKTLWHIAIVETRFYHSIRI